MRRGKTAEYIITKAPDCIVENQRHIIYWYMYRTNLLKKYMKKSTWNGIDQEKSSEEKKIYAIEIY